MYQLEYENSRGEHHMQKVGTIKFVQIQRESLKLIQNPSDEAIYQTSPLEKVKQLRITDKGFIGIGTYGQELVDVHNESHPQSRYRGDNKLSFGFLQNYERMRGRFGDHIKDGYAGENIIIDADIDILNLDYKRRFFFKHEDSLIELKNVIPAPPCRPFSVFCLIVPQCADDIKGALQFLSKGTRGYYAEAVTANDSFVIQAGDELLVV